MTNREWWDKHRAQFEQTERHLKERIAYYEARAEQQGNEQQRAH